MDDPAQNSLLTPVSAAALADSLGLCSKRRQSLAGVDLKFINRMVSHVPEDMTVTVESGMSLSELQRILHPHGQWLPVDPAFSDRLTLEDVVASNLSGPRRLGFGPIRDHVIGMKVALADGRIIRSGGQVVKNVAGYDLLKLFIGARRSLGIIVELSFKLLPLPESETFLSMSFPTLGEAEMILQAITESPLVPSVLDLHDVDGAGRPSITLGFSGCREEVQWQVDWLVQRHPTFMASDLHYEASFWSGTPEGCVRRQSVLPSRLVSVLEQGGYGPFVARAGNGSLFQRLTAPEPSPASVHPLAARIKEVYDPANILPPLPA